jgi:hypothetical protein
MELVPSPNKPIGHVDNWVMLLWYDIIDEEGPQGWTRGSLRRGYGQWDTVRGYGSAVCEFFSMVADARIIGKGFNESHISCAHHKTKGLSTVGLHMRHTKNVERLN